MKAEISGKFTRIFDGIKDIWRAEVVSGGLTWKEGHRCPKTVAGLPCPGVLKKATAGPLTYLYCSEYAVSHTVDVYDSRWVEKPPYL